MLITTTDGFKALELDSRGRNQGPTEKLLEDIDPDGIHVVAFQMPHNDVEWRAAWYVKLNDIEEPVQVLMDNGFEAFKKHTMDHEKKDK